MSVVPTLIRGAYGGLPRSVWLLAITQLVNRSGTMVIFFLAVYLKDELHFNLSQVGVIMSFFGAGSLLGIFIGGKLVDKIGYYPVMLTSLVSGGIMFIVASQLQNFTMLCAGLFLLSALSESFRPANMAAVSHYSTPATYTRSISLNRLAVNLGFSVGPAIGGILAHYSYQLVFIADGITCLGAALMVGFFLENKNRRKVIEERTHRPVSTSPYRDKIYMMFLLLSVMYAISFFQFFSTMPLYYKEVEHLTETQIGWIMALNGLIVVAVEMIMIYKIEKKMSSYNFIALGAALLVLSYIMLTLVHGMGWLIIITVIISFSEMLAMPFMVSFMNSRSDTSNKGQYAALYGMSWSVGQILTPLISTQVIAFAGYNALWITLAMLSLATVLGMKLLSRIRSV